MAKFKLANWGAMIAICACYILIAGGIMACIYPRQFVGIYSIVVGVVLLPLLWPVPWLGKLKAIFQQYYVAAFLCLGTNITDYNPIRLSVLTFFEVPTIIGGISLGLAGIINSAMTTTAAAPLKITDLSFINGEWSGNGKGIYPTIKSFEYTEVLKFTFNGKQIEYNQTSNNVANGGLMHFESGFIRVLPTGKIELNVVQSSGVADHYEGTLDNSGDKQTLFFKMTGISRTPTAKSPHVTNATRRFTITNGNEMNVYFEMATTTHPDLVEHLNSNLKKK
ncbi:p22-like superoxide-generating NADPH oxidase light subunit [Heterostelium album PN500]|uniref:p22-like superoxide-generating NADPH oxidase light subunit n=1 Tax=Heterostelium pallidum (strain ATCC 26659 / Pp 5 / PN500) TaxID=670386 RepID=D3BH47_HETP5|nr:p22-like superoxide-generating NADPH oxidase light subunit [Heterostelium album PN500]EFA79431.1 p22-like superoxide-generating NADPH oxidase light subunit [Heterostelium album PN500]|eukprot:XP_020431552.1 p22-like superoxide-generating NADPH oxidase light subunit [Heterostelium album PN500]